MAIENAITVDERRIITVRNSFFDCKLSPGDPRYVHRFRSATIENFDNLKFKIQFLSVHVTQSLNVFDCRLSDVNRL